MKDPKEMTIEELAAATRAMRKALAGETSEQWQPKTRKKVRQLFQHGV